MPPQEDSDIKIFGKPTEPPDENDLLETAAFLNRQRANGNITKAKTLGEELAMFNPDKDSCCIALTAPAGNDALLNPVVRNQVRALVVFIAQTALHKRLNLQLLSSCAVNAMYDKIIETAPDFYTGISDGAAFTFYSLALKDSNEAVGIGERFAMLAGMEGNAACIAFGSRVYEETSKTIDQIINKYQFAGIA